MLIFLKQELDDDIPNWQAKNQRDIRRRTIVRFLSLHVPNQGRQPHFVLPRMDRTPLQEFGVSQWSIQGVRTSKSWIRHCVRMQAGISNSCKSAPPINWHLQYCRCSINLLIKARTVSLRRKSPGQFCHALIQRLASNRERCRSNILTTNTGTRCFFSLLLGQLKPQLAIVIKGSLVVVSAALRSAGQSIINHWLNHAYGYTGAGRRVYRCPEYIKIHYSRNDILTNSSDRSAAEQATCMLKMLTVNRLI